MAIGSETAPIEELLPPQGAPVGMATAFPGEYGQSLVRNPAGGRHVVGPLVLTTPGRYALYGTLTDQENVDLWREHLVADAAAGQDTGPPPFAEGGEPQFMKGMYADLVVTGELPDDQVLDVLDADERFDTLHDLIVDAGPPHLEGFLIQPTWNHTLLAPTDDAFAALPDGVLDALRADPETLVLVLDHQTLLEYLRSEDITSSAFETIAGSVDASVDDDTIRFDDATVVEADIEATNGIIHAVDTVLVPDSVDLDSLVD